MTGQETSPRTLLAQAAASGVATALVPPSRIPVPVRSGIHVTLGLIAATATAWGTARGTTAPDGTESRPDGAVHPPLSLPARFALVGTLGTLAGLSSAAGMGLDAAAERSLVRRGVQHPRVWIGLAAAGLTAATAWGQASVATHTTDTDTESLDAT